jgi:hypothetical protein
LCFGNLVLVRRAPSDARRGSPTRRGQTCEHGLGLWHLLECLAFQKVDFEYKPQKPDGTLDAGVHFKFNIKTNSGW